jgi:hypothetical protein
MSIEEATVSNILEIAAIVEVLERKGLCTKHDLPNIITGFRCLLPVKTRSMRTTVLSDAGDRERTRLALPSLPLSHLVLGNHGMNELVVRWYSR